MTGFLTECDFVRRYDLAVHRIEYHYDVAVGWIAWRPGTGGGVELFHLRAFVPGRGDGRRLVRTMLGRLDGPPDRVVFGFALPAAAGFYARLGFRLTPVEGLYRDGPATLFVGRLDDLKRVV